MYRTNVLCTGLKSSTNLSIITFIMRTIVLYKPEKAVQKRAGSGGTLFLSTRLYARSRNQKACRQNAISLFRFFRIAARMTVDESPKNLRRTSSKSVGSYMTDFSSNL